jgi:sirohydrochlorin cobaltochelatase
LLQNPVGIAITIVSWLINFSKFTFLNQTLNSTSAYLLVAHGSRNPQYRQDLHQLARSICQQLLECKESQQSRIINPSIARSPLQLLEKKAQIPEQFIVSTACLEFDPTSLQEQIENIALDCIGKGIGRLKILPLFLAAGVHLTEDIPREISLAEANLNGEIEIELLPHLGSHPNLLELLREEFDRLNCSHRLLLAHGSRRQTAQSSLELMADRLDASMAYTAIEPSLRERAIELITAGATSIAILPYFIFAGRISETIVLEVQALQSAYPQVRWQLGEPLGASGILARSIELL